MATNVSVTRRRISNKYTSTSNSYSSTINAIHREMGRLYGTVDILVKNVSIDFTSPFGSKPFGWVKVYRMKTRNGKYYIADVLYYFTLSDWYDTDHFELVIDESESLTDLVLEYYFTE